MADTLDSITKCVVDGVHHCYHLKYTIDDGAGMVLPVNVRVWPKDMADPDDEAEAKTLGNVKAAVEKAYLIEKKAETIARAENDVTGSLSGEVTL